MHFTKGLQNAVLIGAVTGGLLSAVTSLWQVGHSSHLLPLLAGFWWLIIFGCSLWLAYKISTFKINYFRGFALQLVHAFSAVGLYAIAEFFQNGMTLNVALALGVPENQQINAGIFDLNLQPVFVIPAAFVLCIITSGLLFSILNKPSSK